MSMTLDFVRNMNYHSVMNSNSETNEQDEPKRGARRRARTRGELLAAARQVFAQRGFHDASIVEITQAADVGVGTFYLHFRDKDEVFNTLLDEGFGEIREHVRQEIMRHSDKSLLPVLIRTLFQQAYSQRDLFHIALTAQFTRTRAFYAKEQVAEGLLTVLENERYRKLLQGYDIPLLTRFLSGMIIQGILWWSEQDEPGPDVMAEQALLLLRHGLPEQLLQE